MRHVLFITVLFSLMSEPVHVAILRTVKPGCETAFEQALHQFVQKSLSLPGQMGVHIIRPAPAGNSRQYGVLREFADRESLIAFRTSEEYLEWNEVAVDLTEGGGKAEELTGLESWLTLPNQPLRPLPQWKMAIATYLGVVPVIMFLSLTLGRLIGNWNFVANNIVFNAFVVALLTWVVMPLITRALHGWLHPE
jgi:antibiotic biosynthesis monooxygenase (ABM) superfamily enzyme